MLDGKGRDVTFGGFSTGGWPECPEGGGLIGLSLSGGKAAGGSKSFKLI